MHLAHPRPRGHRPRTTALPRWWALRCRGKRSRSRVAGGFSVCLNWFRFLWQSPSPLCTKGRRTGGTRSSQGGARADGAAGDHTHLLITGGGDAGLRFLLSPVLVLRLPEPSFAKEALVQLQLITGLLPAHAALHVQPVDVDRDVLDVLRGNPGPSSNRGGTVRNSRNRSGFSPLRSRTRGGPAGTVEEGTGSRNGADSRIPQNPSAPSRPSLALGPVSLFLSPFSDIPSRCYSVTQAQLRGSRQKCVHTHTHRR